MSSLLAPPSASDLRRPLSINVDFSNPSRANVPSRIPTYSYFYVSGGMKARYQSANALPCQVKQRLLPAPDL